MAKQMTILEERGTKRELFVNNLMGSRGKAKRGRYLGSPIRYAGGKSLAVGLVLEHIPEGTKRLISPFLGGGSVEVACAIELGMPVLAFDIFQILMTYWDVQLHHPTALYHRLLKLQPTREEFSKVKARLKKHWDGEEMLGKLDLAAHFYFNHNTSYGPHFLGWPSNIYLDPERYKKLLAKVRGFRADKLEVACKSFEEVIPNHKHDFLYCDPPYFLGGDSKTFVGMYPHRNFPIYHNGFRHDLLRDMLLAHKGGFVLSYNDCSKIRKWYKGFQMTTPSWQYSFSQGDTRIGPNRLNNNNGLYTKKSHELLIWRTPK